VYAITESGSLCAVILIAGTLTMGMVLVHLEPAAFTRSVGSKLSPVHFTFLENSIVLGNWNAYMSCTMDVLSVLWMCFGKFVAMCLHVELFTWNFL
jgi:hypothetical protein